MNVAQPVTSSKTLSQWALSVPVIGQTLALGSLILPLVGCSTITTKPPIPASPAVQKAREMSKELTLPAATIDLKEMHIRFYHPEAVKTGVPVAVCFCNGACTRWHDRHGLSGKCGHHALPPGNIILIDRGIWESKIRSSKHGHVLIKDDRSKE